MKIRQRIITFFLFLTFLLIIFQILVGDSVDPGDRFEGWLGRQFTYSGHFAVIPVIQYVVCILFIPFCAITPVLWTRTKITESQQQKLSVICGTSGIIVVVLFCFIPQLLAIPFFDELTLLPVVNFYLKVVNYPNPMIMIGGPILLIMGAPEKWKALRNSALGAIILAWLAMPLFRIYCPVFYVEDHSSPILVCCFLVFLVLWAINGMVIPYVAYSRRTDFTSKIAKVKTYSSKGQPMQAFQQRQVMVPRSKRLVFGTVDENLLQKWGVLGKAIITVTAPGYARTVFLIMFLMAYPSIISKLLGEQ